ncbi:hypothetical protein ILUMI_11023 [Ignelater luminosus]|uniref:Uncharacterized protein n=1 Tax=Ignelater luminosus TaxID=2038154 RepID=A0A8K0GAW7_IGNLU|nr:hypothetical protein ILUMI_11023 [Ignelater luminosus]
MEVEQESDVLQGTRRYTDLINIGCESDDVHASDEESEQSIEHNANSKIVPTNPLQDVNKPCCFRELNKTSIAARQSVRANVIEISPTDEKKIGNCTIDDRKACCSRQCNKQNHRLTGKSANRKTHVTPELREGIVKFIKAFADQVAVPLPGRFPQFKDFKVMKLPSVETKISVCRYIKFCEEKEELMVGDSLFYKLWSKHCPCITSMKPADDLCDTCHQNVVLLMRAGNLEVKKDIALEHINRAKT